MTTDNETAESVEETEAQKSFFARGALLGLVGGALVALMVIGVAGTVVSLADDMFASSTAAAADDEPSDADPVVAAGKDLATNTGCIACHSANGTDGTGPTWKGLSDAVDEADIRKAILDPNAVIADGFTSDVMPDNYSGSLSADDLDALVAYISSL